MRVEVGRPTQSRRVAEHSLAALAPDEAELLLAEDADEDLELGPDGGGALPDGLNRGKEGRVTYLFVEKEWRAEEVKLQHHG